MDGCRADGYEHPVRVGDRDGDAPIALVVGGDAPIDGVLVLALPARHVTVLLDDNLDLLVRWHECDAGGCLELDHFDVTLVDDIDALVLVTVDGLDASPEHVSCCRLDVVE